MIEILWMLVKSFLVGGLLCAIGQVLIMKTQLTSARILVGYVTAGVILGALGLYKPIVDFAGAGATVPLLGFGYALARGAIEGVKETGILGAFTGGVTAAAGAGASDQLFDIRPYRYAGFGDQLDAVFGYGRYRRGVDHFRVDRHLYGFRHVTAGQVDGRRHPEVERNVGFLRRDQSRHDVGHVAARQEVRFQVVGGQMQTRFGSGDHLVDDDRGRHLAEPHQHQLQQTDAYSRYEGRKP